jgi:hypothetical protein
MRRRRLQFDFREFTVRQLNAKFRPPAGAKHASRKRLRVEELVRKYHAVA